MNKSDWENAFGKPTEEFHNKLVKTLDSLEKENETKMKKVSIKKSAVIAVAAVLLITTAAFASSGKIKYISSHSYSTPEYTEVPTKQQLEDKMGRSPKILKEFSNGYTFKDGSDIKDCIVYEDDNMVVSESKNDNTFNSIICRYIKDGDELLFSADAKPEAHEENSNPVVGTHNGINITYDSYTGKDVPADYKMTEQDKEDEASGKYIFAYGASEIKIKEVQGVEWSQDGIYYCITAIDSPLGKEELVDMVKEVIDYKE